MPEVKDDKDDMQNKYVETGSSGLSTATSMSDRDRKRWTRWYFSETCFSAHGFALVEDADDFFF